VKTAQISGDYPGVDISGGSGFVVNFGQIASTVASGVYLQAGGDVTNEQGGSIAGVLIAGGSGYVANSGTITLGVDLKAGGTVVNAAGGYISGGVAISHSAGTVANQGAIKSTGTAGIGLELGAGGSIANGASGATAALIEGGMDGIYLSGTSGATITNFGTIQGAAGVVVAATDTAANTVINQGTIDPGGDAILFPSSNDRLVVDPGAVFTGEVDGGGGTLELAAGTEAGQLLGLGTSFVDFGTMIFDPGAAWTVEIPQGVVFTGAFSGFAAGDVIDLSGVVATSASYAGGVLTLDNGNTAVASFDLAGTFDPGQLAVGSDGNGGTDLSLAAPRRTRPRPRRIRRCPQQPLPT
jgi:hypothetical protein